MGAAGVAAAAAAAALQTAGLPPLGWPLSLLAQSKTALPPAAPAVQTALESSAALAWAIAPVGGPVAPKRQRPYSDLTYGN